MPSAFATASAVTLLSNAALKLRLTCGSQQHCGSPPSALPVSWRKCHSSCAARRLPSPSPHTFLLVAAPLFKAQRLSRAWRPTGAFQRVLDPRPMKCAESDQVSAQNCVEQSAVRMPLPAVPSGLARLPIGLPSVLAPFPQSQPMCESSFVRRRASPPVPRMQSLHSKSIPSDSFRDAAWTSPTRWAGCRHPMLQSRRSFRPQPPS